MFSGKIDKKEVDAILASSPGQSTLSSRDIDFVLILVREGEKELDTIRDICQKVERDGAAVESMIASLVTVCFGAFQEMPDATAKRFGLVKDLSEALGAEVAIVHGRCRCPVGAVGSTTRKAWTALLPDFRGKLYRLTSLKFGEVLEV